MSGRKLVDRILGRPKAPAPTAADTIRKMDGASDTIKATQRKLERQVAAKTAEIKAALKAKDKKKATRLLKQKKLLEKQLSQHDGKLENLDVTRMAVENAGMRFVPCF